MEISSINKEVISSGKESIRMLVIEGSTPLREGLRHHFSQNGFIVDAAITEDDGIWLAGKNDYDVLMMDLASGVQNGFVILEILYAANPNIAVVTMGDDDPDRQRPEEMKEMAGRHLLKPFPLCDALEAVNEAMFPPKPNVPEMLEKGTLEMDPHRCEIRRNGHLISLTAVEYEILNYLIERAGSIISRNELWKRFFPRQEDPAADTVDAHIGSLRRKLSGDGLPDLIQIKRRYGYTFETPVR